MGGAGQVPVKFKIQKQKGKSKVKSFILKMPFSLVLRFTF